MTSTAASEEDPHAAARSASARKRGRNFLGESIGTGYPGQHPEMMQGALIHGLVTRLS